MNESDDHPHIRSPKGFGILSPFAGGAIRSIVTITVLSSIGKAIGFIVPFLVAAWYGADKTTDAVFFAYGFVLTITWFIAPVFESVIVPVLVERRLQGIEIRTFVLTLFYLATLIVSVLSLGTLGFLHPFLSIMTAFDPEARQLLGIIVLEIIPLVFLITWSSLLTGCLNAINRFNLPAIALIARSVVTVIVIALLRRSAGIHAIAWGYVAGETIRFLMVAVSAVRKQLIAFNRLPAFDSKIRLVMTTVSVQTIGMILQELNPMIDKIMSSWLPVGSVSVLHYAERLNLIPITFFSSGLVVVLLSRWSQVFRGESNGLFKVRVLRNTGMVTLGLIPVVFLIWVTSSWIMHCLFRSSALGTGELNRIRVTWLCYLLGFIPALIVQLLSRALLIYGRLRVLLSGSCLMVFSNIGLNLMLMPVFGVPGLAVSTSLVWLILSIFYLVCFLRSRESADRTRDPGDRSHDPALIRVPTADP